MLRLSILVSLIIGLSAASGESDGAPKPAVAAATLLTDNRELCEGLASGRSTDAVARAGRKALARETLAIADEMVRRVPRRRPEAAPLEKAVRLQRRLCGGRLARGEKSALCTELESAEKDLVELVPIEPVERDQVLRRFLDRRERAALEAIEGARAREASSRAAAEREPEGNAGEKSASEENAGRRNAGPEVVSAGGAKKASAGDQPPSSAAVERRSAGAGTENGESRNEILDPKAAVGPGEQRWSPSPVDLARRRQARQAATAARMAGWRPLIVRQLLPVVAARARLHRELGKRSLEQSRGLCFELGQTAEAVDYRLVLESPERDLRSDLDRMLAGYVGAGSWCRDGRFSFAWTALSKADEHWRRVGERLARARH